MRRNFEMEDINVDDNPYLLRIGGCKISFASINCDYNVTLDPVNTLIKAILQYLTCIVYVDRCNKMYNRTFIIFKSFNFLSKVQNKSKINFQTRC